MPVNRWNTKAQHETLTLPNIDLVIFDCDGVLIDSELIASRVMSETLLEFGVTMDAAEAHRTFTGSAEVDNRIFCRKQLGIRDIDALFEVVNRRLYSAFAQVQEIEGISQVVRSLHSQVCVASNSSLYRLTRSLGRTDVWLAFNGQIFSADQVGRPKPAPDLLLHCAREHGVAPERSILIDDGHHGVEAAVAAGMLAIGFIDPDDPRPDRTSVLKRAGASFVALGAKNLPACLEAANGALGQKRTGEQGASNR
ncbi:HAD family hydrolase [Pararhizobium sp. O133]|uniref:HAD family hydrolase n=1 Tax=Pararhizobium sp. O133 TaxID=3449278 RepID=UPI003F689046